jgi:hypothetical protein
VTSPLPIGLEAWYHHQNWYEQLFETFKASMLSTFSRKDRPSTLDVDGSWRNFCW